MIRRRYSLLRLVPTDNRLGWFGIARDIARGTLIGRRIAVDQLLEVFAGFEVRHLLGRYIHTIAGLRVPAFARFALTQPKCSAQPGWLWLAQAIGA